MRKIGRALAGASLLLDEVHAIVDPLLCPTGPPPVLAHLPLIRVP